MSGSEFGVEPTTLIFRIGCEPAMTSNHEMIFRAPGLPCAVLDDRIGETVVLGASDVPGIWTCHSLATLVGYRLEGAVIRVLFDDIRTLPVARDLVTGGDPWADSLMQPYALDVVPTSDLELLVQSDTLYAQPAVQFMMAQEAGNGAFTRETSSERAHQGPSIPEALNSVGQTYGWRCAFTGIPLGFPDDEGCDGAVIDVSGSLTHGGDAIECRLFASSTIARCYANGLLAIGDDYDIVRHRLLPAEIRTILDVLNPRALLFLPEEESHWPNLELAREHRLNSGL